MRIVSIRTLFPVVLSNLSTKTEYEKLRTLVSSSKIDANEGLLVIFLGKKV